MNNNSKGGNFFWASYADLMTSLFFIMLVLFVLSLALINSRAKNITRLAKEYEELAEENRQIAIASQKQIDKIKEIENAVNEIDSEYFVYQEKYKKHVLNINVHFNTNSSNINELTHKTKNSLLGAGHSIQNFINESDSKYSEYDIKYLLVIEGQASKDAFQYNFELSYSRALALFRFWQENGIVIDPEICEVLISGSGTGGVPRDSKEERNQRFLIHIIPKPGVLDKKMK